MLTELKKALVTTGDGATLLPYDLDPILEEELLLIQPLAQLLEIVPAKTKVHEYRMRASHPSAWFEGEVTPQNPANSTYVSKTVTLKIQRIWGSVSGFQQAVSEAFVNALEEELMGSLEGMANTLEFGQMYGIADDIGFTGDAYQYSGFIPRIYAYAPENVIDAGGDKISLVDLDNAIEKAFGYRGAARDPRLWMMSKAMKLVVDGLQTRVQIPLGSLELFDGKITMASYADIPILETDYLKPASTTTSPSLVGGLTASDTGGSLAAADYNYRISSVTMTGEQVGGAAASADVTVTTGTSGKVTLAWTADANAKSYMIFRRVGGSGDYQLIDIIAAKTYDTAGTVNGSVESYVDTGAKSAITQVNPLESGEQMLVLINRNPNRGVAIMGKVDDMGQTTNTLFNYVDLARTKDTYDYMLKGYVASRVKYPQLMAVIRHAKLA